MNKQNSQKIIIEKYIDCIKNSTSNSNLSNKLRPILSRKFSFQLGNKNGGKTDFPGVLLNKKNNFENSSIRFYNNGKATISFKNKSGNKFKHILTLEDDKITSVTEKNTSKQNGGQGYVVNTSLSPIAGKPVITPYYECCRPIFNGSLLTGGKRKKQKGGKADTGYYLDVAGDHLNVLPQYRAYYNSGTQQVPFGEYKLPTGNQLFSNTPSERALSRCYTCESGLHKIGNLYP